MSDCEKSDANKTEDDIELQGRLYHVKVFPNSNLDDIGITVKGKARSFIDAHLALKSVLIRIDLVML